MPYIGYYNGGSGSTSTPNTNLYLDTDVLTNSGGTLTCAKAGTYKLYIGCPFADSSGKYQVQIYKNGTLVETVNQTSYLLQKSYDLANGDTLKIVAKTANYSAYVFVAITLS